MNSKLVSVRILLAAIITVPLLTACETKEDRMVASAQQCINTANASNVDACVDKVAGIESAAAYRVRCSSHFIAQGITESKLVQGFKDIKSSTSGGIPTTTIAMSYLLFDNPSLLHTVAKAKSDCARSGAASLHKLLMLSNLGTLLGGGAIPNGDASGLQGAIAGFAGPGNEVAAGNMAIEIKGAFCDNGGSFAGTDVCTKVNQAYIAAGGDPQTIGQMIADLLD